MHNWEPEPTDWYLICSECGDEFWVGQSCSCSGVEIVEEWTEETAA